MPKTPIDKNHLAAPGEDEVRPSGEDACAKSAMEAVAVPGTVEQAAHREFRLGVLAPDAGHIEAALFGADCVGHAPIVGVSTVVSHPALSMLMIEHRILRWKPLTRR